MVDKLIKKTQTSLDYFFKRFDQEKFKEILQMAIDCRGSLFFTGIGKSGAVAQKIVQTLISVGYSAHYLSPVDALHGDLGIVTEKDLLFLLSKSGESDELLSLLPYLRNKGSILIAVCSNKKSRLVKGCDASFNLPLKEELCPFNMAPTTSCVLQLIFGDLLTVSLMEHSGVTLEEFAQNHPAGRIGKRLNLKVKDLMLKGSKVPKASPDVLLVDALSELSEKRCGCLTVVDDKDHLQGIFTDGDLRRVLQKEGASSLNKPLFDVMNTKPKTIDVDLMAYSAMKIMEADQKNPVMILPVCMDGVLKGLIRMHDIVQSGL